MAATKRPGTTLGHIEAGCRSNNRLMPEEVNRIVADHAAHLRFAATSQDFENLRKEGLAVGSYLVGSTGIESCLRNAPLAKKKSVAMATLSLQSHEYALATIHRTENTNDKGRLSGIMNALSQISDDLPVVFPAHPRTARALEGFGLAWPQGVRRIPPLGYIDFLALLGSAKLVLTDSGGVQEEAAVLGTRCFTLRNETEWTFTVDAGVNTLTGVATSRITQSVRDFLRQETPSNPLLPQWIDDTPPSRLIVQLLSGRS